MLVDRSSELDVVTLLRELHIEITEGHSKSTWLLKTSDNHWHQVTPMPAVQRLNAHSLRASQGFSHPLYIGATATDGVRTQAEHGRINILTSNPLQLIIGGHSYQPAGASDTPAPTRKHRPAWIKWGVMRYLLLATQPTRHHYIAAVLGTSQQSVSNSARSLGPLVEQTAQGLVAADKSALLAHWVSVYPGPGGQPFGWYSVETPREQASKALELAQLLGDNALLSGDMAADHLAPWKTPTHSIVYTHSPVGLSEDGFVPAPVDQATLVTCTPMDPTVWKLAALMNDSGAESLSLADPALIYWDTRNGTDPDSQEAADQIARLLLSHRDE